MLENPPNGLKTFVFVSILTYILYYIYVEITTVPKTNVVNGTICRENGKKDFKFTKSLMKGEFMENLLIYNYLFSCV